MLVGDTHSSCRWAALGTTLWTGETNGCFLFLSLFFMLLHSVSLTSRPMMKTRGKNRWPTYHIFSTVFCIVSSVRTTRHRTAYESGWVDKSPLSHCWSRLFFSSFFSFRTIGKKSQKKKNSNAKCQKNMEAEDEKNRLHVVVVGCEDMQ